MGGVKGCATPAVSDNPFPDCATFTTKADGSFVAKLPPSSRGSVNISLRTPWSLGAAFWRPIGDDIELRLPAAGRTEGLRRLGAFELGPGEHATIDLSESPGTG